MKPPGRLIASGRDADIFEYGDGLVLKRSREGRPMEVEARAMEYARAQGYPAPAVSEISADGLDLAMQRIDGRSMIDVASRRPWAARRFGTVLGDLHVRLHEIAAPDWAEPAPCGTGDRLLHLDLHPLNVMLTADGPVVIDWARPARGDGAVDVAVCWIIIAGVALPAGPVKGAVLGRFRSLFVEGFLSRVDRAAARPHLDDVLEWKAADVHMHEAEIASMRAMARREAAPSA